MIAAYSIAEWIVAGTALIVVGFGIAAMRKKRKAEAPAGADGGIGTGCLATVDECSGDSGDGGGGDGGSGGD